MAVLSSSLKGNTTAYFKHAIIFVGLSNVQADRGLYNWCMDANYFGISKNAMNNFVLTGIC